MDKHYYLNGAIMPFEEVKLHISDLSITRGYGIFDFLRTANGKPLFLTDHLARFKNSASAFLLDLSYDDEEISRNILKLIKRNGFDESAIKLVLTGGYSENGFDPGKPNFAILVDKLVLPDAKYYEEGAKLISIKHIREFHEVKSINYLMAIINAPKCKASGALDTLFHDGQFITEATRSNFFIFKGNTLVTPKLGILKGITRKKVLEIAREHFKVEERELLLTEAYDAEEAFITSSSKRIIPIVNLDDRIIGQGVPGKNTQALLSLFLAYEKDYMTNN